MNVEAMIRNYIVKNILVCEAQVGPRNVELRPQ